MSLPPPDRAVQRRVLLVLSLGQVLAGVGLGAGVSIGALLLSAVAGDESISGLAATAGTLGAAVFAIPLARLASRAGRRPALATGAGLAMLGAFAVIGAATLGNPVLLLVALLLLGVGTAVNLQARFAATDLASSTHRGRDLSIVVWTTTIGIVVGPNLVGPGQVLGASLGLPDLTGPFLITAACQIAAAALYLIALRPDPLREARRLSGAAPTTATRRRLGDGFRAAGRRGRAGIAIVSLAHATMVAVMAMTPVHLAHQGASFTVIGLTISLHTLGMFGLSPVFGALSDRIGRGQVVLVGEVLLAASLLTGWMGSQSAIAVTIALILLGLGWSAVTVAGSAIVAESTDISRRPSVQGLADTVMSLSGAAGGALAGLVLALIGFSGLNAATMVLVVAGAVLALRAQRTGDSRSLQPA